MTVHPTMEDVLERVVSLGLVVRDVSLIESALARPKTTVFGKEVFDSLPKKTAALMHSMAQNQALLDGNKRLALGVALLFLRLNDHRLANTHDELFDLMIDMSHGLQDITAIALRLRVVPLPQ
jgi:death on curing protein